MLYHKYKKIPSHFITIGGFAICLILFLLHGALYRHFFIDDAYITFRYVKQFTSGNGVVYNIGEFVEGYSNFLWLILLSPFQKLGLDIVPISKFLGLFLAFLTLIVTWQFGNRFKYPFIAPLFLVCSGPFIIWTMGGLETHLFAFLLVLASYTFVKENDQKKGICSAVWFGLLAVTRPEGIMFAGIALLFRSWTLFQEKQRPFQQDWIRLGILIAIFGSFLLWRYSYYGDWLPNTYYAKSMGFHPRGFIEGTFYIYQIILRIGGIFFVLIPIGFALIDYKMDIAIPYLFLNVIFYFAFIFLSGGDWMPLLRFGVHILPLIYLLVAAGLTSISNRWPELPVKILILCLVIGQMAFLSMISLEQFVIDGEGRTIHTMDENDRQLSYLLTRAESGDVVALTQAGKYAYFLPLDVRIVDMIGLNDAHIARVPPKFPNGLTGSGDVFGKWDIDYVLEQEPDIIEIMGAQQNEFGVWSSTFTGTTELLNDPRFAEQYVRTKFGFFEKINAQ